MNKLQRVLLLEKSQADINSIIQQVKRINSKSEFQSAISKVNFEQKLKNFKPDLILANYKLPALSGIKALEIAKTHVPDTPFIFVTDAQNEETAAECIKRGASDYILKTNLKLLVPAIENVLKLFQKQTKEASVAISLTDITKQKDVLAALQTSEKMFRKMADNIPDGLIIIEHGMVKFFNDRICQITGYSPAEIINLNLIDLAAPEEKERLAEVVKEEQKTGYGPRELEFWIVCQDGTRRYLHNRYSYSREAGKIATRYIIITDLTEHKEAEQSGEQERVLLKTLIDHLPGSIFIKDQDFKKILVNSTHLARVTNTLGRTDLLTEGDLLGKTDFEVYPQQLAEEYYTEDQRVIKNGETILNKEQFSFDKDGQPKWELISKIPLRDKDGSIIGLVGIANDITTLKRAAEAISESVEKYRSLAESSKDSIYLVDENGYFLFANNTYLSRLGQPIEQVLGKSYSEFHHRAETREFLKKIKQVFRTRQWLFYEHRSHRDNRYFIRTLSPVNSPIEDKTVSVTVISKDITERKQAEETLRDSETEKNSLIEEAPIAICNMTLQGKITLVNKRFEDDTGYSREEVIGKNIFKMNWISESNIKLFMQRIAARLSGGSAKLWEIQFKGKDQKWAWITLEGKVIKKAGIPVGFQLVATNITERKQMEKALQESEEKYRNLVERANDGIAIVQDTIIQYVNPSLAKVVGYDPQQLIGSPFADYVNPENRDTLIDHYKRRMANEDIPPVFEITIKRKDGSDVTFEANVGIIMYQGKPAELVIIRDITERKQAEEALRESERKLKDAQVLGRVGSWEFDVKSQTITWSDQTYSLYERNPLLGPPTVEEEAAYYTPEQARVLHEFARRAIEEGRDFEYDLLAILPSRKQIFLTARMHPVKDAHDRVVRLFGTVQDITERKLAEEALRQSEHKYRTLFTTSRDGIAMADLKGNIFDCNQAYADMLGYSPEEIKQLKYLELTPKKWHKQNEKMVNMVMELGYSEEFEKEYIKKDGTVIPVSLRTWRIDDENGKPVGIGSIIRDITERQQMIQALRESEKNQRIFSFRLTRILNVINQLSSIQSIDELCQKAVEQGIQELGFNRIGLWFLSEDLKTMHGSYGTDETGSIRDERHIQLPVADFAVSKMLKSKQQVVFLKNEVLVGKDAKPIGRGNHAIAKLIAGNKIIGILGVDNLINKRPITEQDQEILSLYATALANLYSLKKTEEKLKATQKIYQQAIQNAHGIPYLLNYITKRYDYIGADCQQVLGISPNQMSLTKLRSLIKESHVNISGAPNDENTAAELFKSGKVDYYQSDIKIVTPKGQTKWLSDSAVPYKDEISGKIVGSLGILQEITDRKRSEAVQHVLYQITNAVIETTDLSQFLDFIRQALGEIIDTTNFFVALYDKQNDSLTLPYFVDQKDRFTSFPAGRSLTGYIIKKNQPLLVCEQDIKKMAAKGVIDLIGTPSKVWLGVPIMFRNEVLGAVVVQSYTNQNAYHQNDLEVLKFISNQIGVLIDRKQADVALRASEERFRSVFEDSPVGIALYNTNGNFIECNSEFFNILGITKRQLIQQINLFEIAIMKNSTKKNLFQRKTVKFEQEINFDNWQSPHSHRGTIYLNVLIAPFHTERSVFNYLVQIQDITDHKKIEQELLRSEKLESIGMLAGGIAHDFNNILTGILGNVSLARIYAKDDEIINERLSEAEKAVMRARDLTQRLLTFSKGGLPIKKITDIANLIEESAKFVLAGSKAKSIIQRAADLWAVEADEGQINQVLNNIIINADQAMPEGGIINIQVENYLAEANIVRSLNPGKYVKISITDQGIGIPSEHLSKIFDPYFTTKKRGSGLGLATAFSIVKNHNGKIEVVSELGKGSIFTVYLPATEAAAEVHEHVSEEQPLGEGRVLVVDDEKIVREVVAEMIRHLGYEVNAVKDGREALAQYQQSLAANQPYDAIIMDLTIPGGMGGKKAISQLLAIDPDAKVIVSSGYSTDPIMSNFSQYGFKGVVAKPYDLYELGRVLKKVITGK